VIGTLDQVRGPLTTQRLFLKLAHRGRPACFNVAHRPAQFISKYGLLVTPVVGWIPPEFVPVANAGEVDEVFYVPLERFLSATAHEHSDFLWDGMLQRLHGFHYAGQRIWGLTAGILIHAATVLLDRAPEFEVHVPGTPTPMSLAAAYTGDRYAASRTAPSGHL